ncbi:YybH family protein [Candidatus Xianfuyuplasma coldseepsis]|uniref:Nuclear transport factor 2 family protein n=1 Tax=Candidatus Xianfuyuplasma coldseepsis TaxID=2782163 RepID=A0A7L7KNL2_9MOLU|nr:nuclear transport factor 2 family protein [Xianfuyuplasma coldseepsis]QMS84217.1 nuclear transport factor 2 family protein [Xianfuyuplasma coldseepsis]
MTKEEQLLEIDRQFARLAQTEGVFAWRRYCADDVLMATSEHNPYVEGWSSIEPSLQELYSLDHVIFTWSPTYAFVSGDNSLGVTTGLYERTYLTNGETKKQHGKYVNVWRKISNQWTIVFDMGN